MESTHINVEARNTLFKKLQDYYEKNVKSTHLRELLKDEKRNNALKIELDNIFYDFSHEKLTVETLDQLEGLVKDTHLFERIEAMFRGVKNSFVFFLKEILIGQNQCDRKQSSSSCCFKSKGR